MTYVGREQSKYFASYDGEELVRTSSLKLISQVLNEEIPEEVESHILNGNSINFEIDHEEKELLNSFLEEDFYKENSIYTKDE